MSTQPPQASAADLPPPPATNAVAAGKKGKGKKSNDPVDNKQAIQDTIRTMELKQAGDRAQELEIEREVKKANREMSSILSSQTPMSRIETIQKKYTELLTAMKKTERELAQSKKREETMKKERDFAKNRVVHLEKGNKALDSTVRVYQDKEKRLEEENKRIFDNETQMRLELHDKLEGMVQNMQDIITQHERPEELPANIEQDDLFRSKFKSFIEQYEMREAQFQSILRMKELEVQYQQARYEGQRKAQEQEANKSKQLTSQVSSFSQTETELRSQLNIYVEKFKQVEDTLNNSNDLFLTFRKEMEEMSKKTKRLEKENTNLTRRHEATQHSILVMAEERQRINKESNDLQKKNEHLEKLCRGMQAQGRGRVADVAQIEGGVNGNGNGNNTNGDVTPRQQHVPAPVQDEGLESTGSEYDDDYEDQDGGEEDDEDDDEEDEDEEDSLAEEGVDFDISQLPPRGPTLDMDGNPTKFVLDPNDKTRSAATQWNDWWETTRNHADFLEQQRLRQERLREAEWEREQQERQNGNGRQQQSGEGRNPDRDLDRHAMPPPPTPTPPRAQQTQMPAQTQAIAKHTKKENARPQAVQVNGVNGAKH